MSFAPPVSTFFFSIIVGLILGAIWDCLRLIRKKIGDLKKIVFVLDITFFILVSVFTICFFFFFTDGGIRSFALVGELLGFILFYSVFEKPIFPLLYFIISAIAKIAVLLYKIFEFSFLKPINSVEKVLMVSSKKILKANRSRKIAKFSFFRNLNKFILRKNVKNVNTGKKK